MEKDWIKPEDVVASHILVKQIKSLKEATKIITILSEGVENYEKKIIEAVADTLTNTLGMPKGSFVYSDIMEAIKSVRNPVR